MIPAWEISLAPMATTWPYAERTTASNTSSTLIPSQLTSPPVPSRTASRAASDPTGTVPILIRSDTPATQVSANGDNIAQRGTNYGAAYVTLLDTSGTPLSVGGGTQYVEDAAAAANPTGTVPILIRSDTPA